MKTALTILLLSLLNCCSCCAYEMAGIDTIKQQIVGTWVSDATSNTCERSDKVKNPASTSQIRITYYSDGTFIGRNVVATDGKFERNLEFKGTYRILLVDFEGLEVPSLLTHVVEVKSRTQFVECDERTLERIVMDEPKNGESALKHMLMGFWHRPGSLNPCPRGEVTYSYWVRKGSE